MRETRGHVKAAKRFLRSLQKEPVRVGNLDSKKTNKKTSLAKPKKEVNTTENNCNSCNEAADHLFSLPCNHLFCKDCVRGLFVAALDDPSLLPVKCCGKRVDQRLRRAVLTLDECDRIEGTQEELEAPNKMYCPKPECSAFHNLDTVTHSSSGRFLCSGCNLPLCAKCRASHPNMSCTVFKSLPAADRSLNDLLFYTQAQQSFYAQCKRCRRFIEHRGGCDSMLCRCGHSFRYSAEIFKGAVRTATKRKSTVKTKKVTKHTAYVLEEAPCSHAWSQYNNQIDGALLCHFCRRHKRCYQVQCSQCYMRACPSCTKRS